MSPIEITVTCPELVRAAWIVGSAIVGAALIYLVKK